MPPNQPFQPYNGPPGQPAPNMSQASMKSHKPWKLIIALVFSVLLLMSAAGFGIWAYTSRADYKNNSDKKSNEAVEIAIQKESSRKDKEFTEAEKNPLKKYQGPPEYGTVDLSYPKTWSAYVVDQDKGSTPLDAYFHPNFVPGVQSGTAFALRIKVTSQPYSQELKKFESDAKSGKVKISAFTAKNVPGTVGSRIDGEINSGQQGSLILLPLRDKTLFVSTESQQYIGDFNSIILANLKFVP